MNLGRFPASPGAGGPSPAPSGLAASQPGPQWVPENLPNVAALRRVLVPYWAVIEHAAVAASGTNNIASAIQIGQWPFLWTTLHVGDSGGDDPAAPGFGFLLSDEAVQQAFMSSRIMSRNLMAEGPVALPVPWLFREGATIRSEVENYDTGSARTAYITLGGWLVEPTVADGAWDSVIGLREFVGSPWGYPLPGDLGDVRSPLPFYFNVRSQQMAASATDIRDPAFTVGGREFDWMQFSATQEAGTAGVRVSIRDSQSRQGFSTGNGGNDRLPSLTLLQHGPIQLPFPYRLPRGNSLAATFENLDTGAAQFGRASFGGVLV